MTALNIIPILGSRSAIGLAKETTLNTPVTPAVLVPGTELTLATDAGMFFPSELTGYRDKNINPLLGNREHKGNLVTPYFPSIAVPLFIGAIGPVFGHTGTSVSTAKNGTLAAAAAGATSVTYTITNGTPAPIMGDYFQVGAAVGNFGSIYALNGNQVIKVGSVSGAGPYVITTVDPLLFAISASTVAQACVPPFYAAGQTSEVVNLPSFTLEKTYGRLQSLQYSGCLVNKYDFNLETGKKEAEITVDLLAMSSNILNPPSSVTPTFESPFVSWEGTFTAFGQTVLQAHNLKFSIDNMVTQDYVFNNSPDPGISSETDRLINGSFEVTFASLDTVTNFGYYEQMLNLATGSLSFIMTHITTGESLSITFPNVVISKVTDTVKKGERITSTVDFEAFLNLGMSNPNTCNYVVANSKYYMN